MENIKLFNVDSRYIDHLAPYSPHLFHNKKAGQQNERKYIGVILHIHGLNYFAPLSSFKPKHIRMKESLDFLKIKDYAVINLNTMFPIPDGVYTYVDIAKEQNPKYKSLLLAEYRYIRSIQEKIRKNAENVYKHKIRYGTETRLAKRCNDFLRLEDACRDYPSK